MLLGDGTIVNQSLEGLPIFTLEHHFQLPPAGLCGFSFFGIDVKGLQEVHGPGVESLPVLSPLGAVKLNLEASQHGVLL